MGTDGFDMKALTFNGADLLLNEIPLPDRRPGDVLIQVHYAGICNTDHEILRGYTPGFTGVPGHEFVGWIREADNDRLVGSRATAEINIGCESDSCAWCNSGMQRHCPNRAVLGIQGRDGVMAQYVAVPERNVVPIPDSIPDNQAIFIEPLAAACEILEQISVGKEQTVLVLGDGKLAQLIARVLGTHAGRDQVVVCGKHSAKKALFPRDLVTVVDLETCTSDSTRFDIVVEATGSPSGLDMAVTKVRPRGCVVLKSTCAASAGFNPAPLVVNEITCVGSRCGRFAEALDFLVSTGLDLSPLISAIRPLVQGQEAFALSAQPDVMKVVLDCSG